MALAGTAIAQRRSCHRGFWSLAKIKNGDGKSVFFWRARWINGRNIEELAPKVFLLVPTRNKNRRRVVDALIDHRWMSDNEGMDVEARMHCIRLWLEISGVSRDVQTTDSFTWIGARTWQYSARDTYRLLRQGAQTFGLHKPI
jgi:hypothetical protein